MTPEQIDLARQLVAEDWWEWRDRCAVLAVMADGAVDPLVGTVIGNMGDAWPRVLWVGLDDGRGGDDRWGRQVRAHNPKTHLLPDLTDAATGGVLLGMLPKGMECTHNDGGIWAIEWGEVSCGQWEPPYFECYEAGITLAEACARALLAIHE